MQVNGFNHLGLINQNSSSKLEPGQRLFVEVISKKPSGEGIILLEGQEIPALMEISAEAGDKLWVKIRESNEKGLLLVRELQPDALKTSSSKGEKPQTILLERGVLANSNIVKVLDIFNNPKQEIVLLLQNLSQASLTGLTDLQRETIAQVLREIPQWANVSGENGAEIIPQLLKAFGIDYEARLKQILKAKQENQGKGFQELLFSTLKPLILQILQDPKSLLSALHLKNFEDILDQLTGQQLWLRTGDQENAFVLLHLPFKDNGSTLLARVAIESTRKGNKMDTDHCHLALQMETQILGEVGVDLWFFENNLSIRVLTSQPERLTPLLEQILPLTKEGFSQIGFNLRSVDIADLTSDQEFKRFILGQRKKGVDLQI